MGILSGKDIFSSKYITAEISDAGNHLYYVPIKYVIGDYFLAVLEGQLYAFRLEGNRELIYRHTAVKSFRVLQYTTAHYLPISAKDMVELETILSKNGLPRLNMTLFGIMKYLGKREKQEFTPHVLSQLIETIGQNQTKYAQEAHNIKNYLQHLAVDQIVTPVKHITEFIEDDLLATDPKFLGTVLTQFKLSETEHKKITNTPITGKTPWMKFIAIIAIIGLGGFLAYYAWSSGAFDNMINGIVPHIGPTGAPGAGGNSDTTLMAKYPTPQALATGIKNHEISCADLSANLKSMVNTVHPKPC